MKRNHVFHPTQAGDLILPILILQPQLTAVAAFSDAMVQNVTLYGNRKPGAPAHYYVRIQGNTAGWCLFLQYA